MTLQGSEDAMRGASGETEGMADFGDTPDGLIGREEVEDSKGPLKGLCPPKLFHYMAIHSTY